MNSKNKVIRFLEAWEDEDFDTMQNYSIGTLDQALFSAVDVSGYEIEFETILTYGNHRLYVKAGGQSLVLTVVPEPGPFHSESPSGILIEDLEEQLQGPVQSTDMTAEQAIDYIESTDDLEGFISDGEDRVTVKKAFENKTNDA